MSFSHATTIPIGTADFARNISSSLTPLQLMILTATLCVVSWMVIFGEGEGLPKPRGCKKLSLMSRSSLGDQYDPKYSVGFGAGRKTDGTPNWRVKGLFVYPIKSCGGVEVDEIEILDHGCKYDRAFVFAEHVTNKDTNIKTWEFITQRDNPKMAHVAIDIWEPAVSSTGYSPNADYVQSGGYIDVSYPRRKKFVDLLKNVSAAISQGTLTPYANRTFRVPFCPYPSQIESLQLSSEKVKLWSDWPIGINMGNCIPKGMLEELGLFLETKYPLTLFRKDPRVMREVHRNASDIESLGYQANVNFADSFPINLLNLSSIHDVAAKLPEDFADIFGHKLNAARFRGNFLVTGPEPYAEESWKSITLSPLDSSAPVLFHVTNRTTRCNLPNNDPDQTDPSIPNVIKGRGRPGVNQPLKTMIEHRAVDEGALGQSCLGMMVVPGKESIGQKVRVGWEVKVVKTGKHVIKLK